MYMENPVMIPRIAGKITFHREGGVEYVRYETGRRYDPVRKYNIPERRNIGVRIPGQPELMLPNENYMTFFRKGADEMSEEEKENIARYEQERNRGLMLRDFFDQMFYEFQMMSRKNPGAVVNKYKAEVLNRVLKPLTEMMKEEEYAAFIQEIPLPEETENEDGEKAARGLTYSDVALMLTQYRGAVNRFFMKR